MTERRGNKELINELKRTIQFVRSRSLHQTWHQIKCRLYKFDNPYMSWGPKRLFLFITSKCNMKCNFCPYHSPLRQADPLEFEDMSLETFRWILDRFKQAVFLDLTGAGEPFLHKDIFDMIKYGHKRKMSVIIATNGTIIGGMLERIVNSPLSLLNISLDACSSAEYERMRSGSRHVFHTVLKNFAHLVEKRNKLKGKLKLRVSFVCTKTNYRSIPDKVELAEDLGADLAMFDNLIPFGLPDFLNDQCLYAEDTDVMEVIKSIERPKSNLTVYMPKLYKRRITERKCEMPFTQLTVDSEGNVSTCCIVAPNRRYGNVFQDENVWNNPAYLRMRKTLIDESLPLPDFCKTCYGLGIDRIILNRRPLFGGQ